MKYGSSLICLFASLISSCIFVSAETKKYNLEGGKFHVEYAIGSFVSEGRSFPVEHMDEYVYYKRIKESLENKIAMTNNLSPGGETINVEIHIISEIEKPSDIWVNANRWSLRIVPLWFSHRLEVQYLVRNGPTPRRYSYKMDYDIYYSFIFAPAVLIGPFFERYRNFPAARIADSVDIFLNDISKTEE